MAIYYRKPCFIYCASDDLKREDECIEDPREVEEQQRHKNRLETLGQDRVHDSFKDSRDVAIDFLASLLSQVVLADQAPTPRSVIWPSVVAPTSYQLADREEEFDKFVHLISGNSNERVLLLHGPTDRGKSSLLKEFENLAAGQPQIQCARGDFRDGPSLREFLFGLSQDLVEVRFERFQRAIEDRVSEEIRTAFLQDLSEAGLTVVLIVDTYEDGTLQRSSL